MGQTNMNALPMIGRFRISVARAQDAVLESEGTASPTNSMAMAILAICKLSRITSACTYPEEHLYPFMLSSTPLPAQQSLPRLCDFNSTAGQDTISTAVNMCPGVNYTFYAHTACDHYVYGAGEVTTHFVVHFNGKTIIPSTRACVPCTGDNCRSSGDIYQEVTANVTGPASGVATIQFVITGAAAADGGKVVPFLLDTIYLDSPGYTEYETYLNLCACRWKAD